MAMNPDIFKIDLTADRLCSGQARDIGYWGRFDLIETSWIHNINGASNLHCGTETPIGQSATELSPWDFELQDKRLPNLHILERGNGPSDTSMRRYAVGCKV